MQKITTRLLIATAISLAFVGQAYAKQSASHCPSVEAIKHYRYDNYFYYKGDKLAEFATSGQEQNISKIVVREKTDNKDKAIVDKNVALNNIPLDRIPTVERIGELGYKCIYAGDFNQQKYPIVFTKMID